MMLAKGYRTNAADPLRGTSTSSERAKIGTPDTGLASCPSLHGGRGWRWFADDGGMPMSVMTTIEIITDSVNSDSITPRNIYMKHYECLEVNYE